MPMTRTDSEVRADLDANRTRERAVMREAAALKAAGDAEGWTAGRTKAFGEYHATANKLREEAAGLSAELESLAEADRERRRAHLADLMASGRVEVEGPYSAPDSLKRGIPMTTTLPGGTDHRSAALRALERAVTLPPAAAARMEAIVRSEPTPAHARYLAAVGSEDYRSAFRQVMRDPQAAALELMPEERIALREARDAGLALNASMTTDGSGGAAGGFALPLDLDPTIRLTSDGSSNPWRALATVVQLVQKTRSFVSSDGISASYGAEGSDLATVSPTLAQPQVTAQRASAMVKVSLELMDDWSGANSELARIFSDAKDQLEAEKFALGSGTDEPQGIITALTPAAAAPTSVDDYIAAQNALGARYQANATWVMAISSINAAGQLVAAADTSAAPIIDSQGRLLRRPIVEATYAHSNVLYGDFKRAMIVGDRIGMQVQAVGFLPSATVQGNLSGYRGVVAIWRSGSDVLDSNALVLLGAGS